MRLEEAIQQRKFESEIQKLQVNILFSASWLSSNTANILKPYNISVQQFNVLRILKGQFPDPVSVKEITNRMVDKMSNASRLVDKLYKKGFVDRTTSISDRRQVDIVITLNGIDLINKASKLLHDKMHDYIALDEKEASQANELLDKMRKI